MWGWGWEWAWERDEKSRVSDVFVTSCKCLLGGASAGVSGVQEFVECRISWSAWTREGKNVLGPVIKGDVVAGTEQWL